jgi:hypothetical protein
MNKIKTLINDHGMKFGVGAAITAGTTAGIATLAGATTYDPTSALTGLASSVTSTASPILIAVTVAIIPLGIVLMIVGYVRGVFHLKRR